MDLGLAFDDADFETKEKPRVGPLASYNAKTCTPLWFEEGGGHAGDPVWLAQRLKFSGDYHYHSGNYETAADKYRELIGLIHENNTSMRQDVEESLCRCYMKLNRHTESLALANKLAEMMKTEDEARQRQSLILLSQACRCAGDWKGCVSALEQLASRQTHCAQFWLQLGHAYSHLHLSQTSQSQFGGKEASPSSSFYYAQLTCLVRARLLLESIQNTVGQMIRERNEKTIQSIEKDLTQLGVSQDLLCHAEEVIKKDIAHHDNTSTSDEGAGDCPADKTNSPKETCFTSEGFRQRYFAWADRYLETT